MLRKFYFEQETAMKVIAAVLIVSILFSFALLMELSELREQLDSGLSELKQENALLKEKSNAIELSLRNNIASLDSAIKKTERDFSGVVRDLNMLIVQIEQQSNIKLGELREGLEEVSEATVDFSKIAEQSVNSVVTISTDKGQGSGAIITANGAVVTNYHVVSSSETIDVILSNGTTFRAQISSADTVNDLAILKINVERKEFLELGNSDAVKPGQRVIALGSPEGLRATVTEGIVSAVNRNITGLGTGLIQIDVPVNPGSSGGPLIDAKGKIVGITTAKVKDAEGLGFAIPSNKVKLLIPS